MWKSQRRFVAIPCTISRGAFSGERGFVVQLANGEEYSSLGPSPFFWKEDGQPLGDFIPPEPIRGKIAARIVDESDDGLAKLEIPDGEVIVVKKQDVGPRPTEIKPYASV